MVVADGDVDKIVQGIVKEVKTGNIGDGKIFVSSMKGVVRFRTGERGETAI